MRRSRLITLVGTVAAAVLVVAACAAPGSGGGTTQLTAADSGSESYEPTAASPGMVGVGGIDTWTYQAVGAGTTTIALAYQRASDPTAAQSFTVNVTVAQ